MPLDSRRLLDHQMRIGAAESERADSGAPLNSVLDRPFLERGVDEERAAVERDVRIAALVVQGRRYRPVFQREQDLDHAGHARGGGAMTEIGLDRPQGAVTGLV